MSDPRWSKLDNPEANAKREAEKLKTHRESWYDTPPSVFAEQEQEVLDKREVIEKFADMLAEYKLRGEQIEQFARDNDIPGVCGWSGIENYIDNDIVGDAIKWAASNHNC
ncbi:hypothetical protein PHB09_122 [Pseudomonas phage PHB09]|uniref:Uncharacterized protein n=1 Tax=Pseudomonas phage PHB09 TaxID=2867265 RepID=A0AAE8XCD6_9CAUD|nr:hypothetical protein QGX10_gp121 [Pseudomonas phage PHB09]UAV84617.1 hypothetical protein PHB09_122 [Pseudomonas phage PHB09]